MPSTLGYALLGLLARQDRTGYQLTLALRAPIGYFWTASHSQVYPELSRLEADGLVRHRVIEGPGPRDTKSYRITPSGRRALSAWVLTPAPSAQSRDEFLLRVYSLWTVDPHQAATMVAGRRERYRAALGNYLDLERSMHDEFGDALRDPGNPAFAAYATLRRGISFERHAIEWCDWLIKTLAGG